MKNRINPVHLSMPSWSFFLPVFCTIHMNIIETMVSRERERERGMNPTAMTITNLWEEIARATRDRASDPCSQVLHATRAW